MIHSNIDPLPFADFLDRLAKRENDILKYGSWLNTHPDSKERAAYIKEYARLKGINFKSSSLLDKKTWNQVQQLK